jgi:DNA-binding response OmpR family regulator
MAKILIAEDERDIRELIEFTLTAYAGHQIFKASNGVEAVEMASKVIPDLIMMDVRMPRMTGYEACKALKQIDAVKDVPVVFLSAKGQETEIDTGLDAGAYDYILKPFAPAELATRVGEILKKFEKKRAGQPAPGTAPTPATTTAPGTTTASNAVPSANKTPPPGTKTST